MIKFKFTVKNDAQKKLAIHAEYDALSEFLSESAASIVNDHYREIVLHTAFVSEKTCDTFILSIAVSIEGVYAADAYSEKVLQQKFLNLIRASSFHEDLTFEALRNEKAEDEIKLKAVHKTRPHYHPSNPIFANTEPHQTETSPEQYVGMLATQ